MKSTPKKKRIILDAGHNEDLLIFGIVSAEPDYKLSLSLNRKMGITLRNTDPLSIRDDSGNELSFSRFSSGEDSDDVSYHLISNRSDQQFLLKKLKNIDYILQVRSHAEVKSLNVATVLRQTEAVSAVFVIDAASLNDRNLQYLIQ
jgi:hypothetical protein